MAHLLHKVSAGVLNRVGVGGRGLEVLLRDDTLTRLANWQIAIDRWLGSSAELRVRDLSSSPHAPLCGLLGLPHSREAGFQELAPEGWGGDTLEDWD